MVETLIENGLLRRLILFTILYVAFTYKTYNRNQSIKTMSMKLSGYVIAVILLILVS
jgi:hypothetical protein